jgi:hypothetical protein
MNICVLLRGKRCTCSVYLTLFRHPAFDGQDPFGSLRLEHKVRSCPLVCVGRDEFLTCDFECRMRLAINALHTETVSNLQMMSPIISSGLDMEFARGAGGGPMHGVQVNGS